LSLLADTNNWFKLTGTNFIADKGYDVKKLYNYVRDTLHGHCFIPRNWRNSKNPPLTDDGYIVCEAGIKILKDGKQYFDGFIKQKFVCKFCNSKDDSACPIKHPKYFNGKKHRGCTKLLLYLLIIGPLLIETPYILRLSINCGLNQKDIILDLKP